MGTRSLTIIKNDNNDEICVLYRQYDGYLEGHGRELALFLKHKILVNGYSLTDQRDIANGMANLAVQLITYLVNDYVTGEKAMKARMQATVPGSALNNVNVEQCIGMFYLLPAGTRGYDAEYTYLVYQDWEKNTEGGVCLRAVDEATGEVLADGAPIVLLTLVTKQMQEQAK